MKFINSSNGKIIDKNSLKAGDRVEVCYCDTGNTCVWSYLAIVRTNEDNNLYLHDERYYKKYYDSKHDILLKDWKDFYQFLIPARKIKK